MSNLNLKLKDGTELISYEDDSYCDKLGCPTCGYGREYVTEIHIKTTNYDVEIQLVNDYDDAFTTADAIKVFAVNLSLYDEEGFLNYIEQKFKALNLIDIDIKITKVEQR